MVFTKVHAMILAISNLLDHRANSSCSFFIYLGIGLFRKYVALGSCNCKGVNGKQGGVVENNCYKWRIDPNTRWWKLGGVNYVVEDPSPMCYGQLW